MLLALLAFQLLLAWLLFVPFLDGTRYFAYLDIAADTYEVFTSHAMLMARQVAQEGWSGWSFRLGLGAPVALMFGDAFRVLTMLGGPDHVLGLRIWVYVFKLVLAGVFFYLLVRELVQRKEAAWIGALAYTFCGYAVINGVWDPEANPFVFFPLVLWGALRYLRHGQRAPFVLSVAATLLGGVFFVTFGVSLALAMAACVALSTRPREMARAWLLGLAPLTALGFLIAAPVVLPMAIQLLDSPRLSTSTSLFARISAEALSISDVPMMVLQLGGLFHKDLFGNGSLHFGYMNYLESPGFYVGILPLLLLPQLWKDDRRALVVGIAGVLLYMLLPAIRLSAFGFTSPYFRATTLWVTLGLLIMGIRALDRVMVRGLDVRLLAVGVALVALCFGGVLWSLHPYVWSAHAIKVGIFIVLWAAILALAAWRAAVAARLPVIVAVVAAVEIITFAWPSYLGARPTVTPDVQPFHDVTDPALAAIRRLDPGVYRIEKMYASVSEADAAAQDYMGVKSYYYHGSAVIDFHRNMDLMRKFGFTPPPNLTNWVASPGERYFLYSVLGVKYVISKKPLQWPGFDQAAAGPGWFVYRNELALPLGVVHTRQVTREDMAALDKLPADRRNWFRDLALINAVVVDEPLPKWGTRWDLAGQASRGIIDVPGSYAAPAQALQRTGLQVTEFRSDRVAGRLDTPERGLLVFSIPFYKGWSLTVDGQPAPLLRADFGFMATPVEPGRHEVVLTYRLPGVWSGLVLGACGLLLLTALVMRARRAAA